MTGNDEDLRGRFADLRQDEETQAPGFTLLLKVRAEQSRRWSPAYIVATAVCLAVTIVTALSLVHSPWRTRQGQRTPVASITDWRPSTDFLLQTPGSELLRNVPELGFSRVEAKAPALGNKNRQGKRKDLP